METKELVMVFGSVIVFLLGIIGFFVTRNLGKIDQSIENLTAGLTDTAKGLATLSAKTETILEHHEKRLDTHQGMLSRIKAEALI